MYNEIRKTIINKHKHNIMPFLNFESRHFSQVEETDIKAAMQTLQTLLSGKLASLTSEERQQYGSINEQNKLMVNKVKDYRDAQPQLSSPDVNWEEFGKDYGSRSFLQNLFEQLGELARGVENAKILHDWDNYQASLTDYQYTRYRNDAGSAGFHTKQQEIGQFFSRTGSGNNGGSGTEDPPTPEG
ncbi:hypothetical protein [Chryseobacterium oncorhynchi]|uniref:Uncharacterized protein n=1 Tax=Chryseobacterium oncorhynchi TaxID=741074 RepID=A0A316X1Z2_9FLAO|nr:hypothetical protein [Chryseobacterium oncorhynchi]PWN67791.1 hypothetical protein C1638_004120 [Chryseobacterium oncorhynchi]